MKEGRENPAMADKKKFRPLGKKKSEDAQRLQGRENVQEVGKGRMFEWQNPKKEREKRRKH